MDEYLTGVNEAIRKLDDIAGENGKFMKQSLRTALREGAKILQRIMLTVVSRQSGLTADNIKVRAGPRSRKRISMLVGVFNAAADTIKQFYAGFADFGHMTAQSKDASGINAASPQMVPGTRWTDTPKADIPIAQQKIVEVLTAELADICRIK